MTIWILTILLLASAAGAGFRQGIIRVAFSFVGIILSGLLAPALGHLIRPLFSAMGIHNPLLLWALPPFLAFCVVLGLFKLGGMIVARKVEVFYKYQAGDLRLALWERLNHRLGLCLGLANGAAYLVLLSFCLYALGYWTHQLSSADSDAWYMKIVSRLGEDLQNTGLAKVGRSVDRLPDAFYDSGDVAGMLYHTPLLQARLSRYPGLLAVGERQEFQDLGNDPQFNELWQRQAPVPDLLKHEKVQGMLKNQDLMTLLSSTLKADAHDLRAFLETGRSAKYDGEPILGRWNFDVGGTVLLARQSKTNMGSGEMLRLRKSLAGNYSRTSFVALTDQTGTIKNMPRVRTGPPNTPPTVDFQNMTGQWKNTDGKYLFSFSTGEKPEQATVEIRGDRMSLVSPSMSLAFLRAD